MSTESIYQPGIRGDAERAGREAATQEAEPAAVSHAEHVTVTDARYHDCLEGECDHVDEDGEPEDMSACPILTLEVCVDCMAERHERGPGEWDDLDLVEWPCPYAPEPDSSENGGD